jgi:hypothetical protein
LRAQFIVAIIAASFENGAPIRLRTIAEDCGFKHAQRFSNLLHDPAGVPATTTKNFERVARLIRYPVDQIFVETDPPPRLVKANADEARV